MTRGNVWGWAVGLVNIICFFVIFYQIKLYPDMFLQIYFFCINCLGLFMWSKRKVHEENFGVRTLGGKQRALVLMFLLSGTLLCGIFAQNTHILLPQFFPGPSDYPFLDSFIAVSSVTASLLLLKKYFENWFLWMILDVCCVALYFVKGIYFISAEYVIYFILSSIGFLDWWKMRVR